MDLKTITCGESVSRKPPIVFFYEYIGAAGKGAQRGLKHKSKGVRRGFEMTSAKAAFGT
jgi:hypothetical protein